MSYVAKEQGWVGRQFNRKEDYRLTTGKGQYFSDIVVSGMLHLVSQGGASTPMPASNRLTQAPRKLFRVS